MRAQPGDRDAAPGGLELVQSFVNSINVEFGPDEFATVEGFDRWLGRNGFSGIEPDDLDRGDAVALREALRALLRENNGAEPATAARRTVEHIARNSPLVAQFDDTGALGLAPARGDVREVFGTVLAAVIAAGGDGTWQRLKACREHRCEWAFYDRSRNRASRWCSMAVCGTRSKMTVYRQSKQPRG
ncbi:CGNR zinc finger domain-containing protein [Actinomycetes bacterium KLBMP 9759]